MSKITRKISQTNVEKITLLLLMFSTATKFSHSFGFIAKDAINSHSYEGYVKMGKCFNAEFTVKKSGVFSVVGVPTISVQPASGLQAACINTPFLALSITATDAVSYQWYQTDTPTTTGGTPVGTDSDSYLPPSNTVGTNYYYCVVTNADGSVTSDVSGAFVVADYPNPGVVSGIDTICTNGSTTYTSDGETGGTWSSDDEAVVTINLTSGVISPVGVGSTTIFYTATGSGICPNSKAFKTVYVTTSLNAGVISGADNICTNALVTYTSNGDTGGTWSSDATTVATINATTGVVTPLSAGTATLSYTVSVSGCDDEVATKTITVTTAANAGTLSGNQEICVDGATVFTTNGDLGGVWTSGDTDVATVDALTGAVTAVEDGETTISYTVTGTNGCSNALITREIVVVPYPEAGEIEGTQQICPGYLSKDIVLSSYEGDIVGWQMANDSGFTSPTEIEYQEDVLTSDQLGLLSQTKYIRAIIATQCQTIYSNVVTLMVGQSTTWDGFAWSNGVPDITKKVFINGLYDMASKPSFEACACDVLASGELIIASNRFVTLDKALYNDNLVTIKDGGMLVQIDDEIDNEEAISVERYTTPMTRYDFTYWSSPVEGESLVDLTPDTLSDKFYSFNAAANTWVNIPGTTIMEEGKGYIARAPQSFSTTVPSVYSDGKFFGVPNNGVVNVDVFNSEANKWNLIGNPYPSALNVISFLNYNSNFIESTIYLWTHNTPVEGYVYNSNDYASFNPSGGIRACSTCPTPTKNIASGQAFFISVKYSGTVTFNNSMRHRSYDNTQFFRTTSDEELERHRFWLNLTNANGAFKQTMIGYIEEATNDYDPVYDGENFNANSYVNFYTLNNSRKLSIEARALPFENTDIVPLGYSSTIAGNFSISLDNFDGVFTSENIYLKDNVTQVVHDLKTGAYTFATTPGTFDNRFEIVYQASPELASATFTSSNVVVYKNQQKVFISTGNITMTKVRVYDLQGRLIFESNEINNSETSFSINETNQVLLIQIHSDTGEVLTKKLI